MQLTADLDTERLKVRGWKKVFHASGNQKTVGVAKLISKKIYFKIKTVIRDKGGRYIMIKKSIQEEVTTTKYIYTQHRRSLIHKY